MSKSVNQCMAIQKTFIANMITFFQKPGIDRPEDESVSYDEMHHDAIDADILDKDFEEWNRNRTQEAQQQPQESDVSVQVIQHVSPSHITILKSTEL